MSKFGSESDDDGKEIIEVEDDETPTQNPSGGNFLVSPTKNDDASASCSGSRHGEDDTHPSPTSPPLSFIDRIADGIARNIDSAHSIPAPSEHDDHGHEHDDHDPDTDGRGRLAVDDGQVDTLSSDDAIHDKDDADALPSPSPSSSAGALAFGSDAGLLTQQQNDGSGEGSDSEEDVASMAGSESSESFGGGGRRGRGGGLEILGSDDNEENEKVDEDNDRSDDEHEDERESDHDDDDHDDDGHFGSPELLTGPSRADCEEDDDIVEEDGGGGERNGADSPLRAGALKVIVAPISDRGGLVNKDPEDPQEEEESPVCDEDVDDTQKRPVDVLRRMGGTVVLETSGGAVMYRGSAAAAALSPKEQEKEEVNRAAAASPQAIGHMEGFTEEEEKEKEDGADAAGAKASTSSSPLPTKQPYLSIGDEESGACAYPVATLVLEGCHGLTEEECGISEQATRVESSELPDAPDGGRRDGRAAPPSSVGDGSRSLAFLGECGGLTEKGEGSAGVPPTSPLAAKEGGEEPPADCSPSKSVDQSNGESQPRPLPPFGEAIHGFTEEESLALKGEGGGVSEEAAQVVPEGGSTDRVKDSAVSIEVEDKAMPEDRRTDMRDHEVGRVLSSQGTLLEYAHSDALLAEDNRANSGESGVEDVVKEAADSPAKKESHCYDNVSTSDLADGSMNEYPHQLLRSSGTYDGKSLASNAWSIYSGETIPLPPHSGSERENIGHFVECHNPKERRISESHPSRSPKQASPNDDAINSATESKCPLDNSAPSISSDSPRKERPDERYARNQTIKTACAPVDTQQENPVRLQNEQTSKKNARNSIPRQAEDGESTEQSPTSFTAASAICSSQHMLKDATTSTEKARLTETALPEGSEGLDSANSNTFPNHYYSGETQQLPAKGLPCEGSHLDPAKELTPSHSHQNAQGSVAASMNSKPRPVINGADPEESSASSVAAPAALVDQLPTKSNTASRNPKTPPASPQGSPCSDSAMSNRNTFPDHYYSGETQRLIMTSCRISPSASTSRATNDIANEDESEQKKSDFMKVSDETKAAVSSPRAGMDKVDYSNDEGKKTKPQEALESQGPGKSLGSVRAEHPATSPRADNPAAAMRPLTKEGSKIIRELPLTGADKKQKQIENNDRIPSGNEITAGSRSNEGHSATNAGSETATIVVEAADDAEVPILESHTPNHGISSMLSYPRDHLQVRREVDSGEAAEKSPSHGVVPTNQGGVNKSKRTLPTENGGAHVAAEPGRPQQLEQDGRAEDKPTLSATTGCTTQLSQELLDPPNLFQIEAKILELKQHDTLADDLEDSDDEVEDEGRIHHSVAPENETRLREAEKEVRTATKKNDTPARNGEDVNSETQAEISSAPPPKTAGELLELKRAQSSKLAASPPKQRVDEVAEKSVNYSGAKDVSTAVHPTAEKFSVTSTGGGRPARDATRRPSPQWLSPLRHKRTRKNKNHKKETDRGVDEETESSPQIKLPFPTAVAEWKKEDNRPSKPSKLPIRGENRYDDSDRSRGDVSHQRTRAQNSVLTDTQEDSEEPKHAPSLSRLRRGISRSFAQGNESKNTSLSENAEQRISNKQHPYGKGNVRVESKEKSAVRFKARCYEDQVVSDQGDDDASASPSESSDDGREEEGEEGCIFPEGFEPSQNHRDIEAQLREVDAVGIPRLRKLVASVGAPDQKLRKEMRSFKRKDAAKAAKIRRLEERVKELQVDNEQLRKRLEAKTNLCQKQSEKLNEILEWVNPSSSSKKRVAPPGSVRSLSSARMRRQEDTDDEKTLAQLGKGKKLDYRAPDSLARRARRDRFANKDTKTPLASAKRKRKRDEDSDEGATLTEFGEGKKLDFHSGTRNKRKSPKEKSKTVTPGSGKKHPTQSGSKAKNVQPLESPAQADQATSSRPNTRRATRHTRIRDKALKEAVGGISRKGVWKVLQENGWEYKAGPEPYNMVYVPPDGSVHMGSTVGIHFFECDSHLMDEAIKRGYIDPNEASQDGSDGGESEQNDDEQRCGRKQTSSPDSTAQVSLSNDDLSEEESPTGAAQDSEGSQKDDTILYGNSSLLTLDSFDTCIRLVSSFVQESGDASFNNLLFDPLWHKLEEQGSENGLNWKYERTKNKLSDRSWCFVPPNTKGARGEEGIDYFSSEASLVLRLLVEIRRIEPQAVLFTSHLTSLHAFEDTLKRAMEGMVSYKEAKLTDARQRRSKLDDKRTKCKEDNTRMAESKASGDCRNVIVSHRNMKRATFSQNTLEGAEILSTMARTDGDKGIYGQKETTLDVATSTGIEAMLHMRNESRTSRKRAGSGGAAIAKRRKITIPASSEVGQEEDNVDFHFHLSQTQQTQNPYLGGGLARSRPKGQSKGPFQGYLFLTSGVDPSVNDKIVRLGGKILQKLDRSILERSNQKLFFLSNPSCRRRTKYILAAALGCPMLHAAWVDVITERARAGNEESSVFDSALYSSMRLPVGLSLDSGLFCLQRASHARAWLRPGCQKNGGGKAVFDGLRIALALEDRFEREWNLILSAAGATVGSVSSQKIKGEAFNAVLVDPITLPPHVTAVPSHVAKVLNFARNNDVPVLDLSWAHQCIVQRRILAFESDDRFLVQNDGATSSRQLFSLKVKKGKNLVRYEVSDIVKFARSKDEFSVGRILAIKDAGGKRQIEVQLLDQNGDFELMDGSAASLLVGEGDLYEHVVLLGAKDFKSVKNGYVPELEEKSCVFKQKTASIRRRPSS